MIYDKNLGNYSAVYRVVVNMPCVRSNSALDLIDEEIIIELKFLALRSKFEDNPNTSKFCYDGLVWFFEDQKIATWFSLQH